MNNSLTIALSKGRIFKETLPLLAAAGIEPVDDPETSRKLILDTNQHDVKLVIIRASDVPTYVGYGAADIGVAGKDVLMEHGGEGLYEPLDLGIARCRLMVAGPANAATEKSRLRIATKYVHPEGQRAGATGTYRRHQLTAGGKQGGHENETCAYHRICSASENSCDCLIPYHHLQERTRSARAPI